MHTFRGGTAPGSRAVPVDFLDANLARSVAWGLEAGYHSRRLGACHPLGVESMELSTDEVEVLLQIARDAVQGTSFVERFGVVSDGLRLLVPTTSLSAMVVAPGGQEPEHLYVHNNSLENLVRYATHYRFDDPMGPTIAQGNGVHLLSDFVRGREGKDAFTGEFLPQQNIRHILGAAIPMPDGGCLAIGLQREPGLGDFTPKERTLIKLMAPDLGRAAFGWLLRDKVARMSAGAAPVATPTKGMAVFDGLGDVTRADDQGLAILRLLTETGPHVSDGLVDAVRRLGKGAAPAMERVWPVAGGHVRVALTAAVAPPRRGGAAGRRAPPAVEVVAELEVVRPAVANRFDAVADRLKLTKREREVAALVVEGLGNRGIGARLGMSAVTAGVHLTSIFKKAGVAGRTELTRLLVEQSAQPVAAPPPRQQKPA